MERITLHRVHSRLDKMKGMYSSTTATEMFDLSSNHPTPSDDSRLINSGWSAENSQNYGFVSIDQLRRWIYKDDWLRTLSHEGYVLSLFDCMGYEGRTQAVGYIKYVDPIRTLELTELLGVADGSPIDTVM